MPMRKILLIGLDGATFDLIKPWIDEGSLPNMKGIMDNGVHGELESTVPPLTGPAWSSFMTGKNPGKIGIFDFVQEGKIITSLSVKEKKIWEILGETEMKSILVNIPLTYPPQKVNGLMITGFPTPSEDSEYTYPPELKGEIRKMYSLNPDPRGFREDEKKFLEDVYDCSKKQFRTVRYLMKNKEWDFFMFVLSGTDFLQHFFWKADDDPRKERYMEILKEYFIHVDGEIGSLLKMADKETNVIVVSDHGFGATMERAFYPNAWLERQGLLKTKRSVRRRVPFLKIYNSVMETPLSGLVRKTLKKLPRSTGGKITDSSSVIKKDESTVLFNKGQRICIFTINKKIAGKEFESIRNGLIKKITELEDPKNGRKVFKNCWKSEKLYGGDYGRKIGDVVGLLNPRYTTRTNFEAEFSDINYKARITSHKMNGIFMASGPEIKNREIPVEKMKIFDVAPTVLEIMGVNSPKDMDGKVLKETLK